MKASYASVILLSFIVRVEAIGVNSAEIRMAIKPGDEETDVVAFEKVSKGGDADMPVHMKDNEKALFQKYLGRATSYLEFGAGGSTVFAANSSLFDNLKRIDVVESDPDWVEGLQKRGDIQESMASGKLHFHLVDIGPTGLWGKPTDHSPETASKFHAYSDAGSSIVESLGTDFILVDGRFRVACFLKALKASVPGAVLAVHDYTGRTNYHVVEKFADVIAHEESFYVFQRKDNLKESDLKSTIETHEQDSSRSAA